MFEFDVTDELYKKLKTLSKKNPILLQACKRKVREIVANTPESIRRYKNLRGPLHDLKRVHLTGQDILLFKVYVSQNKILFVDIRHRDDAYSKTF